MASLNHNSKSDFITAIFNRYQHSMLRIASRILKDPQSAEDTVSEAMIKIIKNVDIIALKYGDHFTYREIGLILEMNEDSVRQRAVRARKKLEPMIQKGV